MRHNHLNIIDNDVMHPMMRPTQRLDKSEPECEDDEHKRQKPITHTVQPTNESTSGVRH